MSSDLVIPICICKETNLHTEGLHGAEALHENGGAGAAAEGGSVGFAPAAPPTEVIITQTNSEYMQDAEMYQYYLPLH